MAQWDKTDIVFPQAIDSNPRYMKVANGLNYLQLTAAKRQSRFRRVNIIASSTKRSECFLKDLLFNGVVTATVESVASWEKCSTECRSRSACVVWSLFLPQHHDAAMRGKCVLRSLVTTERGMSTRFVTGVLSGNKTCVGKVEPKPPAFVPAEASVLVLNKKLYFCSFVDGDARSKCYKHHLNPVVVTPITVGMVAVLGGDPYSNTIYGHNTQGQVMQFSAKDKSYSLLSASSFESVKGSSGFVRSKSYKRSELWAKNLTGEFVVNGKSYGMTYYGIYDEKAYAHIVLWLPEKVRFLIHINIYTICDPVKASTIRTPDTPDDLFFELSVWTAKYQCGILFLSYVLFSVLILGMHSQSSES